MTRVEYIINDDFLDNETKVSAESQGYLRELIRCKDCEHRPAIIYENEIGRLNLRFPDGVCPCQCDDPFYSWMPSDNWYCGNAKRRER